MSKIKARLDITRDPPIVVDLQKCDLCGGCVGICPANCIEMTERTLRVIGPDCIKCGFCLPACPLSALSWNEDDIIQTNGRGHRNGG